MHRKVTVARVIDGDSFETVSGEIIHLADVTAPHITEPGGVDAMRRLINRIRGRKVLTIDPVRRDSYGRTVATLI